MTDNFYRYVFDGNHNTHDLLNYEMECYNSIISLYMYIHNYK